MLPHSDMARVTAKCLAGWYSAEQPFTVKKVRASVRVLEGHFCSTSPALRSYYCLLLQEPLASWKDPLGDSSAISSDYWAITMTMGSLSSLTAFPCWQVRFSHCSMLWHHPACSSLTIRGRLDSRFLQVYPDYNKFIWCKSLIQK